MNSPKIITTPPPSPSRETPYRSQTPKPSSESVGESRLANSTMSRLEACIGSFDPDKTPLVNSLNLQTLTLINLICEIICDGAPRGFFSAVETTAMKLVADCTLKETLNGIQMMIGNDPKRQLKAWVMVALNEGLLGAYLSIITANKSASHLGYSDKSILLDPLHEPILEEWFENLYDRSGVSITFGGPTGYD